MKHTPYIQEVPTYKGETEIRICQSTTPLPQAHFAMVLMQHFALVSAEPDIMEDSAGRQKARMRTPAEIVSHARAIAEEAYRVFEQREWLVALPEPQARKNKDEL